MYESDSLRRSACILHSLPDAQLDTRAALNAHVHCGGGVCHCVCAGRAYCIPVALGPNRDL